MKNLTELVFVLDKSGSMGGLEADTIGGYNSLLRKQKEEDGDVIVSTVLFDDDIRVLHDRKMLSEVKELTRKDYVPSGCTALLDAIGETVGRIATLHSMLKEDYVPKKTLVVITTDGLENSSHKFTYSDVKKLIEKQKESGWEFLFLGANISSEEEAAKLGIDRENAVNYNNDEEGIEVNYNALEMAITSARKFGFVSSAWREDIDKDFKKRKNTK